MEFTINPFDKTIVDITVVLIKMFNVHMQFLHAVHRLLQQYHSYHTRKMEWNKYSPAGMILLHSTEHYSVTQVHFQCQSRN